jgi:hypothetical protein
MKATKFLSAKKDPVIQERIAAETKLKAPLPASSPEEESLDNRATRITSVLMNIPFYRDSSPRWGINE